MAAPQVQTVRRRRVFYIPGYDPVHPRRYRELYRKESAEQAAISGYDIALRPKETRGRYGWHIASRQDGAAVEADMDVLVWSDIVKGSMDQGVAATYWQMLKTLWIYLSTGALFRVTLLRKGPTVAAMYPVLHLVGQALIAAGCGWGLYLGAVAVIPVIGVWVGLVAAVALFVALLRYFKRIDRHILAYYLMHDYAYSAQSYGANPPELEARMDQFRATITEALTAGFDEVLVVGHSTGAILGISILADLVRAGLPAGAAPLGFLSLGQMVPMLSFLPRATRLRADLHYLSQRPELTWVDVTAPGDGCAFALCDPVAVTGVAPAQGQLWPLVISCAFTQTFSPERWRKMRYKWFRLHFQYMCAFDRPGDYDYFRITAGPITLADRYRDRAPSKSRITTARSGYRNMA